MNCEDFRRLALAGAPDSGPGPGVRPMGDGRAAAGEGIEAALAAHLDVCEPCGRWLEERLSEPPAGLLPARLEVPSPTLRERSLPVVPASPELAVPPGGGLTGTRSEVSPQPSDGRSGLRVPPKAIEPIIPWWEGWLRPWGQALALAGAAAVVLFALRTGPRLPDQAPGGHQPAPAVSLLAQVQFLDPADDPADLTPWDLPDDLSAEPGSDLVEDSGNPEGSGEGPFGLTDPALGSSSFVSAFDGTFEIAVTDPAADVSHEWSFLERQESDYTFLDDSEKEESWSEESRG